MRILFVSGRPLNLSKDSLVSNIANQFKKCGHDIYIMSPREKGERGNLFVNENGIQKVSFKSRPVQGVSNFKKAIAYQLVVIRYCYFLLRYFKDVDFDLVYSHSLPPELGFFYAFLKRRCRHAICFTFMTDFIVENLISLNFVGKDSFIAKYYKYCERMLFKYSDYLGCPSEGNKDFLKKNYNVPEEKLHLLYYTKEPLTFSEMNLQSYNGYNLSEYFTIIYGGNIGIAQAPECLFDLAMSVREYEKILFMVVGRGFKFDNLKKKVKKYNLTNIVFVDFLPQNEYLNLLRSVNVGLVLLNPRLASPSFPSKTLAYFDLSLPILAAIDHVTDYGKFLERIGAGEWAYSDDVSSLKLKLLQMYNEPEKLSLMGTKGHQFFMSHMLPEKAYLNLISLLKNSMKCVE